MDFASSNPGAFEFILAALVLMVSMASLIFPFIVMKGMRGLHEEIEKSNKLLANILSRFVPPPRTPSDQSFNQVATARVVPKARVVSSDAAISPPSVVPLKISKGGKELGLKETTSIKIMLKKGELTLQDRYFDPEQNKWVPLESHPEFC
jgi:hypothetical protein